MYGLTVTLRSCIRAAAVCASVPLMLLVASPAFAYIRDDGDDPGPGLTVLETIVIYAGIPALVTALIFALVYIPSMARGPRYRPGVSWWASPTWFRGSASAPAAGSSPTAIATTAGVPAPTAEVSGEGGGASARW